MGKPGKLNWVVALAAALFASQAQAQSTIRDCPDCPELVVVPAGTFKMGTVRETALSPVEVPRHDVTIAKSFAIGRTEITRAQFAAFVKAAGYKGFEGKGCTVLRHMDLQWYREPGRSWQDPGFEQDDDHPAVCVSWEDAKAYAAWLSQTTGKKYRLPSEAEWEYAARSGSRDSRPWGDDEKAACRYANVWDESYAKQRGLPVVAAQQLQPDLAIAALGVREQAKGVQKGSLGSWYRFAHWCSDGQPVTAPAGKLEANGFGLHDVIGNAWEWTEDCGNLGYADAPADGSAWESGNCDSRAMRGGSWSSNPREARVATRLFRLIAYRRSDIGFRIARDL